MRVRLVESEICLMYIKRKNIHSCVCVCAYAKTFLSTYMYVHILCIFIYFDDLVSPIPYAIAPCMLCGPVKVVRVIGEEIDDLKQQE